MKLIPPVGGIKSLLISEAVFGIISDGKIGQKREIWCLKRKYLNINFLFIELL